MSDKEPKEPEKEKPFQERADAGPFHCSVCGSDDIYSRTANNPFKGIRYITFYACNNCGNKWSVEVRK